MTTANTLDTEQGQSHEGLQEQQDSPRRERPRTARGGINVASQERWISAGAGAVLVLYGLKRMRLGSLILAAGGAALLKRAMTGHCEMFGMLGINTAQGEGAAPEEYFSHGVHVEESFTIGKSRAELYAFWRNFENLPRFMQHLESVQNLDGNRSHWVAKGPAGMNVKWDAEIINEEQDKLIAWRSQAGADVDNAGSVRFSEAPAGRGTEVAVTLDYIPPAGKAGALLAKLFGRDPDMMIREDLRRFKQLMETGEIPTTQGQPRGNCSGGGQEHEGW